MNQQTAPLFEALAGRRAKGETSFHVPGHKFGAQLEPEELASYGPVMGIDYTEIEGLDDLHHPEGVILEAERLAAECFGAERSYFLVGGSTAGNLALITAVCGRGERILVQRNAHKSVIHGLMLAGAEAVFLQPELDPDTGLAAGVSLHTVKRALEAYPDAKALFLTNPNYYGMGVDLRPYADAAHQAGMPLLVDEAHGAHFGFHPAVPASALSCGADGVVQSTHKMLTAMTMGAMLHLQGDRLDRRRVEQRLAMLQSSSPSYPLMASLDLARRLAATQGRNLLELRIGWLAGLLKDLDRLRFIRPVRRIPGTSPYETLDPFKITLYDSSSSLTGFQLQERLGQSGIITEMADDRHVLLACSLATGKEELDRLFQVLQLLERDLAGNRDMGGEAAIPVVPSVQELLQQKDSAASDIGDPVPMTMEIRSTGVTAVPLEEAIGRPSAETVIPYPPGIPLLFAGEVIRPAAAQRIRQLARAGARFQGGLQDPSGCSILILSENGE
ncbi:aminotransferase class I/II-fold pyridoxal phosphate-dependent enzyme [Gorillibacterium sp. sgz5001074]|uniref:aminotransferase class I/II-fold pyridoxal phosphate-dependent enzyme n=1 Tax=Gorillibacterium sp. sgz5001074 TaxID=3446695 RepID=UPI003F66A77F